MTEAALDLRVEELRAQPGRTWGVRDAVLAMLSVPAVLALLGGLLAVAPALPPVIATTCGTVVLAGLAVLIARRAAHQSGGWQSALGLDLPEWSDVGRVLRWSLLLFVVQAVTVGVLRVAVPALSGAVADNASFLRDEPLWAVLVFAVLAVGVAPVLEELLFRGLVLRGLMVRIGFWPAALISSTAFGMFHAQGADAASALVVGATAVFGVGLCVLTRRTGRLGPGIGVHALRNAVAVGIVVLT